MFKRFIAGVAADSSSTEEVRQKLSQTLDRLHKVIYDESSITVGSGRMAALTLSAEKPMAHSSDTQQRTATVSPVVQQYDITRSVTELLQSAADDAGADRTLTAEQRIISSFSGKSIEEIGRHIRRVYENITFKDNAYKAQVISAAKDVVVSLISRRSAPITTLQRADGIAMNTSTTLASQIPINEHSNNIGVLPTASEPASALSTYFTDLSSNVEQFYAINADDAQGVSYRDIKKAVSHLMNSRTTYNAVSSPLNRILHTDNVAVTLENAHGVTINNAYNHSDTAYNAYSENIYRSQFNELTQTQDIHHEHRFIDGVDVQHIDNVSNGTVLPAEQNSYTLNRSGDVYYAENRQDGDVNISGTQVTNITNAQRTVKNGDNVSNVTVNGTVLPAEQNSYTLNRSGDVYFADNRQNSAEKNDAPTPATTGSYRNRLDSKTLAALDEMIRSAVIRTNIRNTAAEINERYIPKEDRSEASYEEYVHADMQAVESSAAVGNKSRQVLNGKQPDRMQMNQLRTASIMRRGVGITPAGGSSHISTLIEHVSNDVQQAQKGRTVNSSFSYRTIDSGENMVMLIPPTEMDRYQAESGYAKQMPPIDLKQKQEPEPQPQKKKTTAINVKDEPVTVKTIGSIEGMSREEISKLVDKVYEQLETRLLRERRRRGL